MDKIKASVLIKNIIEETQKAFISEDDNFINSSAEYFGDKIENMSLKDVLFLIEQNNCLLRMSYAKSICKILEEYGIVEIDIDIYNREITNQLFKESVHKAINNL